MLREYWKEYRLTKWSFPGQNKEKQVTTRTVNKIFANTYKEI